MLATTAIAVSTVAVEIISTGTTWANLRGASLYDTVPFQMYNGSAIQVRIGGSAITSATGFPIASSGGFSANLMASDPVFCVTSNSTGTVTVLAGRQ